MAEEVDRKRSSWRAILLRRIADLLFSFELQTLDDAMLDFSTPIWPQAELGTVSATRIFLL